MAKRSATETDLARCVIEWLTSQHWDVYQEVQVHRYGRVADIVAVLGRLVWIIECKMSFGLTVIEQADYWRFRAAHWVSIATPPSKRDTHRTHGIAEQFCRWRGIGLLKVRDYDTPRFTIDELAPRLNRNTYAKDILSMLTPEHKTYAIAGNADGRRWTPFKATCEAVRVFVNEHPGCSMKYLLDNVETHYGSKATARACLKEWAGKGKVEGVRLETQGKSLLLYPSNAQIESSETVLPFAVNQ